MFLERFKLYNTSTFYVNRYINFISRCIDHNINTLRNQPIFVEKHHILPKYLFPQYRKCSWNIVELTPRQHFIAHLIMSKIFLGGEKYKAIVCCVQMKNQAKTSKLYEYAKILQSNSMKINNPMFIEEIKKKATEKMKQFYESEKGIQYRKNRSLKMKNAPSKISAEGRRKLSEVWKGKSRPKTENHIENHIKSIALGIWHTPWGDFYSPGQAARDIKNLGLSRHKIDQYCKKNIDQFSFTSFNKDYNISGWKTRI